jgi:acylphosphatase
VSEVIRRVLIQGRVQGVGYRAWVEHETMARGIDGWVRNRRDGSVEALFSGPALAVAEMIASCRRGPSSAKVETVQEEAASDGQLPSRGFAVRPTV